MSYFNCGVRINGRPAKTKKEVKMADPATVTFYGTAMGQEGTTYRADEIPAGVTCSFVGPDPYRSRNWYGNATIKNGKTVIS